MSEHIKLCLDKLESVCGRASIIISNHTKDLRKRPGTKFPVL